MELTTILYMALVGIGVACVVAYYNQRFVGSLVRALIAIDATSPESALSAEELSIKITPALKAALRNGGELSRMVITTEDGKYYILPEQVGKAKIKYRSTGVTWVFLLVVFVILGIAAVAVKFLVPELIDYVSSQFSWLGSEGI